MARVESAGQIPPPTTHFHKQPLTHLAVTSVPTSPSTDGVSDHSTSPPPTSLLTLLRNVSTPDTRPTSSTSPAPILRHESLDPVDHSRELTFTVAPQAAQPHPPLALPLLDADSDSDEGYREDSEDGEFSDDEDYAAAIPHPPTHYPFARPTNYGRHSEASAPAPAVLSPPPRRGRGHIRVDDETKPSKACSRHCSPPPVRSRSGSEARSRTSDAGPRPGRCGSPMPDVSDLPDVDDDEEERAPRWRRASEHEPGFHRSGFEGAPPAVDSTTVLGSSLRRHSDIYHRLETNLASTTLDRTKSLGAKVSFAPRRRPTSAISADERSSRPIACPSRPDDL